MKEFRSLSNIRASKCSGVLSQVVRDGTHLYHLHIDITGDNFNCSGEMAFLSKTKEFEKLRKLFGEIYSSTSFW
jgi:hypothetical protein